VEDEIRKLTRQRESDSEDDKPSKKTKKGPSIIEMQNAKYQRGQAAARKSGRKRDENDVLSALQSFRGKLQQAQGDGDEEDETHENKKSIAEDGEDEGMEVDDDVDWLHHRLHFADDSAAEVSRAEHDYEVIDPRMRGAKAKEEEMERRREKTRKDGGRGFHPRSSHHTTRR
jgi:peptidyl-prolyl cis-trans isomerase SDCCAG10